MPVSLLYAIRNKYEVFGLGDEVSKSEVVDVVFVTKCAKSTAKDGLVIPPMLTLNSAEINEGGDLEELSDVCKNITELDLTNNLLTDWPEVFSILNCMPKVHFLNLSSNNLSPTFEAPAEGKEYSRVTHLILNSTNIPWSTVLQLLKWFPSLQELHLSLNGYTTLSSEDTAPYESLKQIFINQNLISDWSEICKLGDIFPNMDQLVLIGNPIEVLTEDLSSLQNLSTINISQTLINDWAELAKLSQLDNLRDLRLKPLPLMQGLEEKEARQLFISYLPNVSRLNGSLVLEEEKVDAERAFIRRFMDSENKPARYFELQTKYGKLDPLAKVNLKPQNRVKVKLEFMDSTQEKEINIKQTVAELKKDLESVAGLPAKSFRLYHLEEFGIQGKEQLRYLQRNCYSIPIRDGDTIEIRLK